MARHFLVSAWLARGVSGTEIRQPAHGTRRASGRRDERDLLLALGAAWNEVRLSLRLKTAAYWAALYGAYVNWVATILAAVFGTAALSPITSAGHSALPWQEALITIAFMTVALTTVGSSLLLLWGFRRKAVAVS